jgi:hypothetical protein
MGEKKTSSDVDTMICVCTRKATVPTEDSCAGTQPQNLHLFLLVLLVNDSEYSRSTGAKPFLSLSCIYLVSPGALSAEAGEANFSFPLRPFQVLSGKKKKKKKKEKKNTKKKKKKASFAPGYIDWA